MRTGLRAPTREYLRPVKWRNAARRRLFSALLPRRTPLYRCLPVEYMGSAYGGWPVPAALLDDSSIVYSVGAGGDVTFDLGLIERTGCEVHSFDPAPEAASHVASHGHPRLRFHPVAIWTQSGELTMYRAADPSHMALSAVDLQHSNRAVVAPCRTIEAVREELGHSRVDLLKLTVDGAEYDLVPRLDLARLGTRVLVVNLHHNRPVGDALALLADLRDAGFVPVARKGTGYTLALVRPPPPVPASRPGGASGILSGRWPRRSSSAAAGRRRRGRSWSSRSCARPAGRSR